MYYGSKFIKLEAKGVATNFRSWYSEDVAMKLSNVGIIIEYPYVVVDVDDEGDTDYIIDLLQAEGLTYGLMYTTHGAHFWFKSEVPMKNNIKANTLMGVPIDIKSWGKNSQVKVRSDGVNREWILNPKGEDIDYIPSWLMPIDFTPKPFSQCSRGERHGYLLDTVFPLARAGFSPTEIYESLRFINTNLMVSPVDEIDIRAMSIENPELQSHVFHDIIQGKDGKPDKKVFSTQLVALSIQRSAKFHMDERFNLWVYDAKQKIFTLDSMYVETEIHKVLPGINSNTRNEILKKIILNMRINGSHIKHLDQHKVVVNNGILDLSTGKLEQFDENIFNTRLLKIDYKPNAPKVKALDTVLDNVTLGDPDMRLLLLQMFAYTLCNHSNYQKAFMLIGEGSNGKSIILDLLTSFVGSENKSNIPLNGLKDDTRVSSLLNKYVNIGDDIGKKLEETENFKSITAGMEVNVRRLYENPFSARLFTKLVFAANELPITEDKSKGFFRRWIIIPFNATFDESDPSYDPNIGDKIKTKESIEYLLVLCVKAYQRLIKDKKFITTTQSTKAVSDYRSDSDSVYAWLNASNLNLSNLLITDTYDEYLMWCTVNGLTYPVSYKTFRKAVPKHIGVKAKNTTRQGKQVYVWG